MSNIQDGSRNPEVQNPIGLVKDADVVPWPNGATN